jgi:hypothetical protein
VSFQLINTDANQLRQQLIDHYSGLGWRRETTVRDGIPPPQTAVDEWEEFLGGLPGRLDDAEVARRRATILQLIASLELVEIDAMVLDRAAQPMPTELATVDAIHLATALQWKAMSRVELVIATHDGGLGLAAQSCGLPVVGAHRT